MPSAVDDESRRDAWPPPRGVLRGVGRGMPRRPNVTVTVNVSSMPSGHLR
jgi:hypothetical protein